MRDNDRLWWPYVLRFLGQPWFQIFCPIGRPCVRSSIPRFYSKNMGTIWQTHLYHCGTGSLSSSSYEALPSSPGKGGCPSGLPLWALHHLHSRIFIPVSCTGHALPRGRDICVISILVAEIPNKWKNFFQGSITLHDHPEIILVEGIDF